MTTTQFFPTDLEAIAGILAPTSYLDAAALAAVCTTYAAFALRKYTWDKPDPLDSIFYERPQEKDGAMAASRKTRDIAQRLEELNKDAVIFWGSQSGTAEGLAARLGRELHQRFRFDVLVADLSDFDPESLARLPPSQTAIFILATYGEGDPSDNASPFWEWLHKQDTPLSSMRYAAFGLGNSHYHYFNRVAEVVAGRLQEHGATPIMPLALADDANGTTEEDFNLWKDELLKVLQKSHNLDEHEVKYEPSLQVIEDSSLDAADLFLSEPVQLNEELGKKTSANSPIWPLPVRSARTLFDSAGRSCIHMDFDLGKGSQASYKTGDHLAIWPRNPDQEVQRLLRLLGAEDSCHTPLLIKAVDSSFKIKIPTPTTLHALFRHYLEICAPVPRDVVLSLAEFAPSSPAKDFFVRLGKDRDAYAAFVEANHVNIGRLLELAGQDGPTSPWAALPISFLLESLPRTRPRYYSISSSSIVAPRSPSITVGIADSVLPGNSNITIPGLATNYLRASASAALTGGSTAMSLDAIDSTVFAHIRRSDFKLPASSSCPLLMVAAGTGLAPFRAFIEERHRLQAVGKPIGKMILFFGCQHPERDYIYQSELRELQAQLGTDLQIVTAFSRVEGESKVYVQDRIREMGRDVCDLLDEGASFYACGRASMAREAGRAVRDAVMASRGWSEAQIKQWGEDMKRHRKWQEDVWG